MNVSDITNLPVLVLNQNYEPLNVCRVRRAVILIYNGKAEMMEDGAGYIHSADTDFHVPSVIRLASQVKHPRPQRKLTRLEVFHRDGFTCQYCGKQTHQLTLDHVVPRYRGGQDDPRIRIAAVQLRGCQEFLGCDRAACPRGAA